jgi:hypothetical protein
VPALRVQHRQRVSHAVQSENRPRRRYDSIDAVSAEVVIAHRGADENVPWRERRNHLGKIHWKFRQPVLPLEQPRHIAAARPPADIAALVVAVTIQSATGDNDRDSRLE